MVWGFAPRRGCVDPSGGVLPPWPAPRGQGESPFHAPRGPPDGRIRVPHSPFSAAHGAPGIGLAAAPPYQGRGPRGTGAVRAFRRPGSSDQSRPSRPPSGPRPSPVRRKSPKSRVRGRLALRTFCTSGKAASSPGAHLSGADGHPPGDRHGNRDAAGPIAPHGSRPAPEGSTHRERCGSRHAGSRPWATGATTRNAASAAPSGPGERWLAIALSADARRVPEPPNATCRREESVVTR